MSKRDVLMNMLNEHAAKHNRQTELKRTFEIYTLPQLMHLMLKYINPMSITSAQIAKELGVYRDEFGAILLAHRDVISADVGDAEIRDLAIIIATAKKMMQ